MVFCSKNALLALIPVVSIIGAQSAFAQDEPEEQSVDESAADDSESAEEAVEVSQQKGCTILINNGKSLRANSKVKLTQDSSQIGYAVVKAISPKGVARAVLGKKYCSNKYVGFQVEVSGVGAPGKRGRGAAQKSSEASGRIASELPKGVEPDSSAHERMRRPFSVRVGAGLMFVPGVTVGAGYNFSHGFSLEGTFDSAGANFLNLYKYSRARFGALAHYFPGNSFFLNGGLVFENFSNSLISGSLGESGLQIKADAFQASISQLQYQFGLGNRWSFGGFFIGTEWVGYSKSLTTLSETYTAAEGYDQTEKDKGETKKFADSGSVRLFNTHLGFAF